MKKVSCVGYHATGSGAVDDFLREFENVKTAEYGIECRFLQDPDGVADLEYNLIDNPHRLNSGFALKRFLLYAKQEERTFRHIFGNKWMVWANAYINNLSKFSYSGYWHGDVRLLPNVRLFFYKARRAINLAMPKSLKKNKYYNYLPDISTYCVDLSREDFLTITQNYCEELCKLLNAEDREYVVLDQAASPQNAARYLRYIRGMKIIVVDRDPRDVYLNDVVRNNDFVLPKDVKQFCEVYRMSRKQAEDSKDTSDILRIRFEDMIYRYEETTQAIMSFLELKEEKWKRKRQYFNPDDSRKNTRLWEKHPEYSRQIKLIEEELLDYLYQYS